MNGGKIINEGAYGCIYNPALKCSANKQTYTYRKTKIHKLQIHNEYAENELKIGKIIHALPDYQKRFSPLYSKNEACTKVTIKQFKNGTLTDCAMMTKQNPTTKVMLLEGNYINDGVSIEEYVDSLTNECDILHTLNRIFLYVVESIQVMVKNQIVHFDLRNPNIVYDKAVNLPIVLDFGISFHVADMLNDYERVFIAYSPKYYIYPPEVLLVSHFIFNKNEDIQYSVSKVYEDCIQNKLYTDLLPEKYRESYKKELTHFFETLQENKSVESMLQTYSTENYYQTWDVYMFCIFFLKLIHNESNEYIEELQFLCYQCLHPNPRERPILEDILIHTEKIENMFRDKICKRKRKTSNSISLSLEEYSLRDSLSL